MRATPFAPTAFPIVFLLLVAGCELGGGPRIDGVGPVVSQIRTVGSFSGIDLRSSAEVVVSQGDTPEVRVEAQQNILDILKTDVHGHTLRIEYFGNYNVHTHQPVKVYVTTPMLRETTISGSGSIASSATWKSDTFRADISGSGKLDLRVSGTRDLHASISGSGGVKLAGDAASTTLNISGSGNVRAYELSAQDVNISISGSGSADVNAARTLSGGISGAGSVHYLGRPIVKCHVSGSGSVNPAN